MFNLVLGFKRRQHISCFAVVVFFSSFCLLSLLLSILDSYEYCDSGRYSSSNRTIIHGTRYLLLRQQDFTTVFRPGNRPFMLLVLNIKDECLLEFDLYTFFESTKMYMINIFFQS